MPAVTLPPPRPRHCNPRRILHYFQMPPGVLWFLVEKHLGCLAGTYWTHTARSALCPGCKAKSQVSKFLPYSIGINWHWEFIPFFHRGTVDFWRSNIMSFNCDHHLTWHREGHRILMSTLIKEEKYNLLSPSKPNIYYIKWWIVRKSKE